MKALIFIAIFTLFALLAIKASRKTPSKKVSAESLLVKPAYTEIVGVTQKNLDGTNRQDLLRKCREGQQLKLIPEPENPHDKNAVKICTLEGIQLGWLDKDDAVQYHKFMKEFNFTEVKIKKLTGGFKEKPTRGCNIEIKFCKM